MGSGLAATAADSIDALLDAEATHLVESSLGVVGENFVLCQQLSELQFKELARHLSDGPWELRRLRPYRVGGTLQIAALWQRGSAATRWTLNQAGNELQARQRELAAEGFSPIDLAGYVYPDPKLEVCHASVWIRTTDELPETDFYVEVPHDEHQRQTDTFKSRGLIPLVIQPYRDAQGRIYFSGIWQKLPERWSFRWGGPSVYEPEAQQRREDSTQLDVAGFGRPLEPAPAYHERLWQFHDGRIAAAGKEPAANDFYWRGYNAFWLGLNDEAARDMARAVAMQPAWHDAHAFAALAHQRQGRRAAAESVWQAYVRSNPNPARRLYFEALRQWCKDDAAAAVELLRAQRKQAEGSTDRRSIGLNAVRCLAVIAAHPVAHAQQPDEDLVALLVEWLEQLPRFEFEDPASYHELLWLHNHPRLARFRYRQSIDRQYCGVWRQRIETDSRQLLHLPPVEHRRQCQTLAEQGWRPVSVALTETSRGQPPVAASVWHRALSADVLDSLVREHEAVELSHNGQLVAAIQCQRRVLAARAEQLDADHPFTMAAATNLAILLTSSGEWDEAQALLEPVGRIVQRFPWSDGPRYQAWREAVDRLLLARAERSLDAGHWKLALADWQSLETHRILYLNLRDRRYTTARRQREELERILDLSPEVQQALREALIAEAEAQSFEPLAALPRIAQAADLFVEHLGAASPASCRLRMRQYNLLVPRGDLNTAERLMGQVLQDLIDAQESYSDDCGRVYWAMGLLAQRRGDLPQACQLLVEACERLREGERTENYTAALEALVSLRQQQLESDVAKGQWQAAAEAAMQLQNTLQHFPSDNSARLAEANWAANDLAQIAELPRQLQQQLADLPWPAATDEFDNPPAATTLATLVDAIDQACRDLEPRGWLPTHLRRRLADTYRRIGKIDSEIETRRWLWGSYRERLGPEHPSALAARDELCTALNQLAVATLRKQPNEAVAARQEVATLLTDLPASDPRRVDAVTAWEDDQRWQKLDAEQQVRMQAACDAVETLTQSGDPQQLPQMLDQASRALAALREFLGETHRDTRRALQWMAVLYYRMGNPARADQLLRRDLAAAAERWGPSSLELAQQLANLALVETSLGEWERAAVHYGRAWEIRRQQQGDAHAETRQLAENFSRALIEAAAVLLDQRRYSNAAQRFTESEAVLASLHSPHDGRVAGARQLAAFANAVARLAPQQLQRFHDLQRQVAVEIPARNAQDEHQSALDIANHVHVGLTELGGRNWPLAGDALFWKAVLLDTLNRADEAERAYLEATAVFNRAFGPDSHKGLEVLQSHAEFVFRQGDLDRAKRMLIDACGIARRKFGANDSAYTETAASLVALYEQLALRHLQRGDYAAADASQQEACVLGETLWGGDHYRVINLQQQRDYYRHLGSGTDRDRMRLAEVYAQTNEAWQQHARGESAEAIGQLEEVARAYAELFSDRSTWHATALFQLGRMQLESGRYVEAHRALEQAVSVRREVLGPSHIEVARALNWFGWSLQLLGRPERAQTLHAEARDIFRSTVGDQHIEFAHASSYLGMAMQAQGKLADAERLLIEARDLTAAVHGKSHAEYGVALNNLALLHVVRKDEAAAETCYRDALVVFRSLGMAQNNDLALVLTNLAELLHAQSRHAEAEPLLVEAIQVRTVSSGPEHPETLRATGLLAQVLNQTGDGLARASSLAEADVRANSDPNPLAKASDLLSPRSTELARVLAARGEQDRAVELLRRAWNERTEQLGADDPMTLAARDALVRAIEQRRAARRLRDDFPGAVADLAEIEHLAVLALGDKHFRVAHIRLLKQEHESLAALPADQRRQLLAADRHFAEGRGLNDSGQHAAAVEAFRRAWNTYEELGLGGFSDAGSICAWLGGCYATINQHDAALSQFRRAHDVALACWGPDHPTYARARIRLGRQLWRMGDYFGAEAEALAARNILAAAGQTGTGDEVDAISLLGAVYHWLEDPLRAESHFREALPLQQILFGESSSEYIEGLINLADTQRHGGNLSGALTTLQQAVDIARRIGAVDEELRAENMIGSTLAEAGQLDQALSVLSRVIRRSQEVYGADHQQTRQHRLNLTALLMRMADANQDAHDFAREATVRRAILELQSELLPPADPRHAEGRQALLRAERLAAASDADRLAAIEARRTVAEIRRLSRSGDYDEALRLSRQVLDAWRRVPGKDHRDYAEELDWQGRFYRLTGRFDEAVNSIRRAWQIYRRALGPAHATTLAAQGHLAVVYEDQRRWEEAIDIRRRVLDAAQAASPDSPATANAREALINDLDELVWAAVAQGDFASAQQATEQYVAEIRQLYGVDHWRFVEAHVLAEDVRDARDLNEAQRADLVVALADAAKRRKSGNLDRLRNATDQVVALVGQESLLACRTELALGALLLETADVANVAEAMRIYNRLRDGFARRLTSAHPHVANVSLILANLHLAVGSIEQAERCLEDAISIWTAVPGQNEQLATARQNMVEWVARRVTREAGQQRFAEAIAAQQYLVDFLTRQYGATDWQSRDARQVLGRLERISEMEPDDLQRLLQADRFVDEAIERWVDQRDDAVRHLREATLIYDQLLGDDPRTAEAFYLLGVWAWKRGDAAQAHSDMRQSEKVGLKTWGRLHPNYARVLNSLGVVANQIGDEARALDLQTQAVEILRKVRLPDQQRLAVALANLGLSQRNAGQMDAARRSLYEANRLLQRVDSSSAEYAASLAFLAVVQPNRTAAMRMGGEAIDLLRGMGESQHARLADVLSVMAEFLLWEGEIDQAVALLEEQWNLLERTDLQDHRPLADAATQLAAAELERGQFEPAAAYLRRAFDLYVEQLALWQAPEEREQFRFSASVQRSLDAWLTLALRGRLSAEQAYQPVLQWKGGSFLHQRNLRQRRAQPELLPMMDELQRVASQLAELETRAVDPRQQLQRRTQRQALMARRVELERQLGEQSRAYQQQLTEQQLSAGDIATMLDEGEVLVDLSHFSEVSYGATPRQTRLLAFVIQRDQPVRQVAFDDSLAEDLASLVDAWRASLGTGERAVAAAAEIKRRFWDVLQVDHAHTVLVAPSGPLARFPLAALPGREPGKYLIEQVMIATVVTPRLLAEMLTAPEAESNSDVELLVLGGVDYNGPAGTPGDGELMAARRAVRNTAEAPFGALQGSSEEIDRIERIFREALSDRLGITRLTGAQATEERFRGAASRARYLHLATHGFQTFVRSSAAGSMPSALVGQESGVHPGLLCGLALAGANRPPVAHSDLVDDGLLTGLEVADLDLSGCRLVVLSACETGVGRDAAGEGMLSLQRAFAVAGVRTTISSLWSVYDDATRELMVEFYRRLMDDSSEPPRSPLQALCEAQRAMIRDYDPARGELRRGLKPDRSVPAEAARATPAHWAAFVLSGDWR